MKGSAFRYTDGTIGLPVYHEFLGKFGERLRIGPDGRVLDKTRFTAGRHALQPEIAILGPQRAVGILRYAGEAPRRVLYMVTDDAGKTWSQPQKIHVPNPDAAVEVLALGSGRLVGVFNDIDEARWRLVLGVSDNLGKEWRTIKVLEQQQDANDVNRYQFSYPWLLRAANGDFHLLYSWNRTRIKHIEFNQSWLEQAAAGSLAVAAAGAGRRDPASLADSCGGAAAGHPARHCPAVPGVSAIDGMAQPVGRSVFRRAAGPVRRDVRRAEHPRPDR